MNDPEKKRVYLALPTYADKLWRQFFHSVIETIYVNPIPGVEWTIGTVGGDGVARSRNNLAQSFLLSTECDYFFPIDVDIGFTRDHAALIVNSVSPQRPIVGGRYPAKQFNHRWILTEIPGEVADPETGLQRVQECGTGFKCYHRRYFEEVMRAFPEIQYFCDGSPDRPVKWDFFSQGVVNGRYLTEDYYTDYRARILGMDIFVQTKCEVTHYGGAAFPANKNWDVLAGLTLDQIKQVADHLKGFESNPESPVLLRCTP